MGWESRSRRWRRGLEPDRPPLTLTQPRNRLATRVSVSVGTVRLDTACLGPEPAGHSWRTRSSKQATTPGRLGEVGVDGRAAVWSAPVSHSEPLPVSVTSARGV